MNSVIDLALKNRNSEKKAAFKILVTSELQANRSIRVNASSFQRREESAGKYTCYLSLAEIYPQNLFERVPIN